MVSEAEVKHFRTHGWLYVPGCFDEAQLGVVRSAFDKALADPPDLAELDEIAYGARGENTLPQKADSKAAQQALMALREPRLLFDELASIAVDPRLGELAKGLLGCEHVRFFAETMLNKPAGGNGSTSRPTPWHQDWVLFPIDRRDTLNIWVAVDDIEPEQGGVQVVSGSHRLGPLAPPSDFGTSVPLSSMLREDDVELLRTLASPGDDLETEGVPVRPPQGYSAGDALVFHGLTIHGAAPNNSDRPRRAYSTLWMDADARYTGMPYRKTDAMGLKPGQPFDLDRYPIVA